MAKVLIFLPVFIDDDESVQSAVGTAALYCFELVLLKIGRSSLAS